LIFVYWSLLLWLACFLLSCILSLSRRLFPVNPAFDYLVGFFVAWRRPERSSSLQIFLLFVCLFDVLLTVLVHVPHSSGFRFSVSLSVPTTGTIRLSFPFPAVLFRDQFRLRDVSRWHGSYAVMLPISFLAVFLGTQNSVTFRLCFTLMRNSVSAGVSHIWIASPCLHSGLPLQNSSSPIVYLCAIRSAGAFRSTRLVVSRSGRAGCLV
jgi:hypothetical protein